jgi:hypothetical protein
MLSHPDDLKAAMAGVQLCRQIGNSAALRPFTKREVVPGNLKGAELERFVRDAASSYWHQSCTAKMGQGAMSVVDGILKIYGIDRLRIADWRRPRVDHVPRHHRKHHGALRHHRRTRGTKFVTPNRRASQTSVSEVIG